jgi:hypothetical protein
MNPDIRVTAQLRNAGEAVGPPVIEDIRLARALTDMAESLAGREGSLGSVLRSMISCALLDEAVFEAVSRRSGVGRTNADWCKYS